MFYNNEEGKEIDFEMRTTEVKVGIGWSGVL